MKKYFLAFPILFAVVIVFAQPPKQKQKEKPPTQKEMNEMMKEMQQAMDEMSPEDKKMMDSMGIKMPDMKAIQKNVSGISDAQLKKAFEDDNRILPKKDDKRIAAIPKKVNDANMKAYLAAIQERTADLLKLK